MAEKSEGLEQLSPSQRALLALKELRAKLETLERAKTEPIAIIGIGCRFPGSANTPQTYWQLLRAGRDAVSEVPPDRWKLSEYYDPDPDAPGKMYTRSGGFIDHIDKFDPRFFGISPREAASMDPQQRLLLEVCWEALEHANIIPGKLTGSLTGVFLGISTSDYSQTQALHMDATDIDAYAGTGNAFSVASGRLSYTLGLQGPNLAIDTACSSSLVAVHLACQSLRAGESNLALAGGVNAILSPGATINFCKARMLAADGRCKTFDEAADGYVRGEGCGFVVLKRLSDALAHGDNIIALIRGSAVNQDGKSNGLTAPNGPAQEAVIQQALARAKVSPAEVSYVEAHGTGTALGDPIEVRALGNVYREGRERNQPLVIGSVKTNFGHLEAAAGISGLIKVALALHHAEIPPHLHFKKLSPHITIDNIPAIIPTQLMAWPTINGKRIAGLSSFGFSGTNAHLVLEGANWQGAKKENEEKEPIKNLPCAERPLHVLALSARSEASLREMADRYAQSSTLQEYALADVCFTANTKRSHFEQRLALLAESSEHAREKLAEFAKSKSSPAIITGVARNTATRGKIAFLFTGQGAQYPRMGKGLYETQPAFRAALDKCDALLRPHLEVPLLEVLYGNSPLDEGVDGDDDATDNKPSRKSFWKNLPSHSEEISTQMGDASAGEVPSRMTIMGEAQNTPLTPLKGGIAVSNEQRATSNQQPATSIQHPASNLLDQTAYTQPGLFALEYALAELWKSWGIEPSAVLGHSVGEYTAACVAGMMSLEEGLRLIAARGRLMQALPRNGAMAAIFAEEEKVARVLAPYSASVSIAAINDPRNIVISGEKNAVTEIAKRFEAEGTKTKALTVSHAFHSPLMEPMLAEFEKVTGEIAFQNPEITLISNLTAQPLRLSAISRQPSAFSDQLSTTNNEQPATNDDPRSTIHDPRTYYRRHIREAVRFSASIQRLHEQGYQVFVEIGPHPTLLGMGAKCLPEGFGQWLPSLRKGQNDWQQILKSLATLHVHGFEVDWRGFDRDCARRTVSLPTYPFQRERYWFEERRAEGGGRGAKGEGRRAIGEGRRAKGDGRALHPSPYTLRSSTGHPLLGDRLHLPLAREILFESQIDGTAFPQGDDLRWHGATLLPAAAFTEMALAAAKETFAREDYSVAEMRVQAPLLLSHEQARTLQLVLTPEASGAATFQIFSLAQSDNENSFLEGEIREGLLWKLHAQGRLLAMQTAPAPAAFLPEEVRQRCELNWKGEEYFEQLRAHGLELGKSFRCFKQLWKGEGEVLGQLQWPEHSHAVNGDYRVPPALLETCAFAASTFAGMNGKLSSPKLLAGLASYRVLGEPANAAWSHVQFRHEANEEELSADIRLLDAKGEVVLEALGTRYQTLDPALLQQAAAERLKDWFYEIEWQAKPRRMQAANGATSTVPAAWLIFSGREVMGAQLVEQFKQHGEHGVLVCAGEEYRHNEDGSFLINPNVAADYERVLQSVTSNNEPLRGIAHAWSLQAAPETSVEKLEAAQELSCASVLLLTQALGKINMASKPRLWLITRGAQPASLLIPPLRGARGVSLGTEESPELKKSAPIDNTPLKGGIAPVQAPLWGFGRVLALEHPELWGGMLDLDLHSNETEAAQIYIELHDSEGEDQIALRHDQRYVARLVHSNGIEAKPITIHSDASYLITGGLGSLGLRVARWLVARGARHLTLTGRTGLPARARWDEPSQQEKFGNAITTIRELEAQGVTIHIAKADAGDEAQMKATWAEVQSTLPALRGIIHAAGVSQATPIQILTPQLLRETLRPKVTGAWILHELSQNLELDFFTCFSSISAIWGSQGLAHYAAANHFLDGFAHHRRALGMPALSLNWAQWAGESMASHEAQTGLTRMGLRSLPPEQALAALDVLLSSNATQKIIANVDWNTFKPVLEVRAQRPLLEHLGAQTEAQEQSASKSELLQRLEEAVPSEREEILSSFVAEQAAKVLGLDLSQGLDPQKPLAEMGLDSLMAVELRNALGLAMGKTLPPTLLFDHPTLEALVKYLREEVLTFAESKLVVQASERVLAHDEPIAIIGMACRFPGGANDPAAYWRMLRDGVDAITEVPASRWDLKRYYDPDPEAPGKMYCRWGGFIEHAEAFDPQFFGIAPREAQLMDPQQLLLLETAWEALEHAGLPPDKFTGSRTGVFVGMSGYEHTLLQAQHAETASISSFSGTSGGYSYAAGRLSYFLGLQGPCMALDTACSSSLVATHLACQSLRNGESNMALVAGVNVLLSPDWQINICKAHMLALDGRCKTFDAEADGFVRSDGCGVLVLKRLADAVAGGDNVLALIRGSAVNQDGRSSGMTAPNGPAQEAVIRAALASAGVQPQEVSYVETHGTGTVLGDSIETRALGNVYGEGRELNQPLAIGSVKTNIGHLEAASGVAGLIKLVLALQHGEIPPHLHFKKINPQIELEEWRMKIPTERMTWPAYNGRRLAGLSAFGLSGTNAHIVVEAASEHQSLGHWSLNESGQSSVSSDQLPVIKNQPSVSSEQLSVNGIQPSILLNTEHRPLNTAHWSLLTVSAKNEKALKELAARYENYFAEHSEVDLAELCYTANAGRAQFSHRLAVRVESAAQARASLSAFINGKESEALQHGQLEGYKRLKLGFLFAPQGAYLGMGRKLFATQPVFRKAFERCDELLRESLQASLCEMFYSENAEQKFPAEMIRLSEQPALFALEFALTEMWKALGVQPAVVMGQELGEYVAAAVAGVMRLEDALALVAVRAHLAAARAQNDQARSASLLQEFEQRAHAVQYAAPQLTAIASLTGKIAKKGEMTLPNYWIGHLQTQADLTPALKTLYKQGVDFFIEIGPHSSLNDAVRAGLPGKGENWLPSLLEQRNDWEVLLCSVAQLYVHGAELNWPGFGPAPAHSLALPTYPFQREVKLLRPHKEAGASATHGKKANLAEWFYAPSWKRTPLPLKNERSAVFQTAGKDACATDTNAPIGERWLMFDDACGLATQLEQRLKPGGHEVIHVIAGEQFDKLGEHAYTIRSGHAEDYDALIQELATSNRMPQAIAYLWNVRVATEGITNAEQFAQTQNTSFNSLLFLAQAMEKRRNGAPQRFEIITNQLHEVIGEGAARWEMAPLLALCKVIPQECAGTSCRAIDLENTPLKGGITEERGIAEKKDIAKLLDQLTRELTSPHEDRIIAYRGQHRWVQSFEPLSLNNAEAKPARLRERGVYVILGGFGRIGFALAEMLARTAQAKLVLINRTELPPRAQWHEWLDTHLDTEESSCRIRQAQTLEGLGAEVLPLAADATKLEQAQNAFAQARARFGEIHGVMHAAGLPSEKALLPLQHMNAEALGLLTQRATSLFVLEKVLQDQPADFCLLLSSLSAVLGGKDAAAHSAASLLSEAFAQRMNQNARTPWLSVSSEAWKFEARARHLRAPEFAMTPTEGVEALQRALASDAPQLVISTGDLTSRLKATTRVKERSVASLLHERPNLVTPYVAPQNNTETTLAEIWQELLGIKALGIHDNFFELGGTSLLGVGVFAQIEKRLGKKLPMNLLLQAPTIGQLATYLNQGDDTVKWSPLVLIQPSGTRPPLFCVHPGVGTVLGFHELAQHLGADQPFYGIQARGLDGKEKPFSRIEPMAAYYIRELRTVQPHGPYFLSGRCFGGLVAYEMAQQLHAMGERVALLAIIDTVAMPNVELEERAFLEGKVVRVHSTEEGEEIGEKWREGLLEIYGPVFRQVGRKHDTARKRYVPQPYPGRVTLFRNGSAEETPEHQLKWEKLAQGGLEVIVVPGDHKTILLEPHVNVLAQRLRACIASALAE